MKTVKSIDTLTKELAALDCAELHDSVVEIKQIM